MYEEILYDVDERIATVTLNRPKKLNAVTNRTGQEIRHAIATAETDEDVVGIILTGAGRGFCAGADMGMLGDIQEAGLISAVDEEIEFEALEPGDKSMGADFASGYTYLMSVRKPIIAAVNGPCAGVGLSMSMFCDLRFASEDAVFVTTFAQRGLVAEHGNSWILPRLIGPSRALDLLWSGRKVRGEEAVTLGIANRVFPADDLIPETRAYLRTLVETASPTSLMHMKQMVYQHLMLGLGPAMDETNAIMDRSVKWPDFKEGISSFVERRPPEFPPLHPDD
jgi:enoyl-CoA hydratase/carnithine racemase